jgi:DNA invertase Pin-like site-specific DNA recombinase
MEYVTYRRVSTKEQGSSGLGLLAQQSSIDCYLKTQFGSVIGSYYDVQSGSKDDRTELQRALRSCRVNKATLVVSKLCRLSRSFAYSAKLLEGNTPIVISDNPTASMFELRLKAAINQEERERISQRTIEALQAKKERGEELGNKEVWKYAKNQNTTNANKARAVKSLDFKKHMLDVITDQYGDDLPSFGMIAEWLNSNGYTTPRGREFSRASVQRILALLV